MKANFRTVAFDETHTWFGLPEGCTKVFGLYLFCEGEATHCCELRPSSWCEFIQNVFIGLPTDPLHPFIEEYEYDNGGEAGSYFSFIDPAKYGDRVSEPLDFENDVVIATDEEYEEFTEEQRKADDQAREQGRDDLWEQAREYVRGNALEPACLWKEMTA